MGRWRVTFFVLCNTAWIFAVGCGAPTKSAPEVVGIFESEQSLGSKFLSLCTTLKARQQEPSLAEIALDENACKAAGSEAYDLNDLKVNPKRLKVVSVTNEDIDDPFSDQEEHKLYQAKARVQLWLNSNLLGLVSLLTSDIETASGSGGGGFTPGAEIKMFDDSAEMDPNDPMAKMAAQMKPKMFVREVPDYNKGTGEFLLTFKLSMKQSDGMMFDLDNDIDIKGGIYDEAIAVSVYTPTAQPHKKSMLHKLKVLLLVVPFANDVYIDVDVNILLQGMGVNLEDGVNGLVWNLIKGIVLKAKEYEGKS